VIPWQSVSRLCCDGRLAQQRLAFWWAHDAIVSQGVASQVNVVEPSDICTASFLIDEHCGVGSIVIKSSYDLPALLLLPNPSRPRQLCVLFQPGVHSAKPAVLGFVRAWNWGQFQQRIIWNENGPCVIKGFRYGDYVF